MSRVDVRVADYIDRNIVQMIIEKYGVNDRDALRMFLYSETYQMLLDKETGVFMMSPLIIFDMWENEKVTGNPRNSQYIRG